MDKISTRINSNIDTDINNHINDRRPIVSPNSTPISKYPTHIDDCIQDQDAHKPSKKTLDFIRQFAYIYFPVSNMSGLLLN